MEKSSAQHPLSDSAKVDPDAVFSYLTEARYPSGYSEILKRAITRKAMVCVVRDGVLYITKKKKDTPKFTGDSLQLIIHVYVFIGMKIIVLWTIGV